jgi:hypothetical protein
MINITTYDENGYVLQNMTLVDEAEADLNGVWIEGHWGSNDYYILNSEPTPRPDLNLPTAKGLTINEDWVVGTLPESTGVYIDGILVGETDETELVLSFPLAQTYSVKFDPPFPYKPHEMEVAVNEVNT